ncbi:hypothetical protein DFP72DRAFT_1102843, partial [Ephemerocybe angulata]
PCFSPPPSHHNSRDTVRVRSSSYPGLPKTDESSARPSWVGVLCVTHSDTLMRKTRAVSWLARDPWVPRLLGSMKASATRAQQRTVSCTARSELKVKQTSGCQQNTDTTTTAFDHAKTRTSLRPSCRRQHLTTTLRPVTASYISPTMATLGASAKSGGILALYAPPRHAALPGLCVVNHCKLSDLDVEPATPPRTTNKSTRLHDPVHSSG